VQQPLIVCHNQEGALRAAELIHRLGDRSQRVDVQTGIGLVQNREPWLEDGELQDLVALFLTAEKPSFTGRFIIESSHPMDLSFASRTWRKSIGSSSSSPRFLRIAFNAERRK